MCFVHGMAGDLRPQAQLLCAWCAWQQPVGMAMCMVCLGTWGRVAVAALWTGMPGCLDTHWVTAVLATLHEDMSVGYRTHIKRENKLDVLAHSFSLIPQGI